MKRGRRGEERREREGKLRRRKNKFFKNIFKNKD